MEFDLHQKKAFFTPAFTSGHHGSMKLNTSVDPTCKKIFKVVRKGWWLRELKQSEYHNQALDHPNDFWMLTKTLKINLIKLTYTKLKKKKQIELSFSLQIAMFFVRQNIHFRGCQDDCSVFSKDPKKLSNLGNNKKLMKFHVKEYGEKLNSYTM